LGFPLIGDDHFLNIAAFSLGFKTEKIDRIRKCGHTVSGLKIREAIEQVEACEDGITVIINVGSVDIIEGKELIQMIKDFDKLMAACGEKFITPIVTTLPPLPNYKVNNRQKVLEGFNCFLRKERERYLFPLIDLNLCMTIKNGEGNLRFYQPEPRFISGSKRSLLMWNKIGRDRVLAMLKRNLGEVLVFENHLGDQC
jgi:OSK domain